jgi:F-type H+-transporting ATPase subunit b
MLLHNYLSSTLFFRFRTGALYRAFSNGVEATVAPKDIDTPVEKKPGKIARLIQLSKDIIPGQTFLSKTLYTIAIGSGSAALVNSGYYIPGEDTLTLTSFLILVRLIYVKAGKPLSDYLQAEIDKEEAKWYADRSAEKTKYANQLNHLESFKDYTQVVNTLFDMKAANVVLEDALVRAKAKNAFRLAIHQKAQELVKKEQDRLINEEKEHKRRLKEELLALLANENVQERILNKAINDLETKKLLRHA